MAQVFISYSRQDRDFVVTLQTVLTAASRDVWVDLQDIPPTSAWLHEIYAGIEGADAFVYVLSPDSVASEVCTQELAHALESRKHIIPLLRRDVDRRQVQPEVAALSWILWRASDDFDAAFQQLTFALDTDLEYWHLASQLLSRARQWENTNYNASVTLRGTELEAAERWLTVGATKRPTPTALHTQFITASRRASTRRQRRLLAGVSVALVVTLALSIVSTSLFQVTRGQNLQLTAKNQQLAAQVVAGQANSDLLTNNVDQGLLLSVEASRRSDSLVTRSALVNSLEYSPNLDVMLHNDLSATNTGGTSVLLGGALAFSADGRTLMTTGDGSNDITLWDMVNHRPRQHFTANRVTGAALSPDGRTLAATDQHGLTFWDVQTGAQLHQALAFGECFYPIIQCMAFSPDGKLLASADATSIGKFQVDLWNVRTGQVRESLAPDYAPNELHLAFSPNGRQLAVSTCDAPYCYGGHSQLTLWDIATGVPTVVYRLPTAQDQGSMASLAYSPDGRTLLVEGCDDATCNQRVVRFWDLASRSFDLGRSIAHNTGVGIALDSLLALSPDGHWLVTGSNLNINTLQLWDVPSRTPIGPPLLGHTIFVVSMAFSPDGQHFVSQDTDGNLLVWRVSPYTSLGVPFVARSSDLFQNLFGNLSVLTPDDKQELTVDSSGDVLTWTLATGHQVDLFPNAGTNILGLAISANGRLLALGTGDGTIILWDRMQRRRLGQLELGAATASAERLVFSPDSHYLAAFSTETNGQSVSGIDIWNVTTRALLQAFPRATSAVFSPDSHYLVTFNNVIIEQGGQIIDQHPGSIWDITTQTPLQTFSRVTDAAFSPDGHLLAIDDGVGIHLYPVANPWQGTDRFFLRSTFPALARVVFSLDGHLVAGVPDGRELPLWDTKTGRLVRILDNSQIGGSLLGADVEFSASRSNMELLAVFSNDILLLWNMQNGTLLARPIADLRQIVDVTFSPDGQFLIETARSGAVIVRYATEAEWQAQACHIANRNLTHEEWSQFFGAEPYHKTCPDLPDS